MILITYILLIITLALVDALFFRGEKSESKAIRAVFFIGGMWFLPLLYANNLDFIYLFERGLVFWFLFGAIFDTAFNLFAGLKADYVGTTDFLWSDIIRKLTTWQNIALRVGFTALAILTYIHIK